MKEAELVFTEILNCDRLSLYLNKGLSLDRGNLNLISSVLKRRICGEPLQYILGKTEFMGLEFKINKDVFIPRPETEILVETVIRYVDCRPSTVGRLTILDIGTGSGCIAVSLAKFLSNVNIIATDVSGKAIEMARHNAVLHGVEDRIRFMASDLFTSDKGQGTSYNIIVSNPPYIPSAEIKNLALEVQHEPHLALDGGRDGLDFYRQIITECSLYLKESGYLVMEIGFKQRAGVENIFKKSGNFQIIDVVKDYNNIDRVIVVKLKKLETRARKPKKIFFCNLFSVI